MKEILDIVMTVGMVGLILFIITGYYRTKYDKE